MGLKLNTENLLVGMLGDSHTIGISSSFNSAISKPLKYLLLPNNKMEPGGSPHIQNQCADNNDYDQPVTVILHEILSAQVNYILIKKEALKLR